MRSRMRSVTISSSSTSSTRGASGSSAGWICVIIDSSCGSTTSAAIVALRERGARRAQFDPQRIHVETAVDAADELGLAHALGEVVVDSRAITALEVEVLLARRQHDDVRVARLLRAEPLG